MNRGPIGLFDSGVGGLTVAASILKATPNERICYVADQAHVPYGGRPEPEIRQFAGGISRFLANQGCRAIVMACNISSATALSTVQSDLSPLPVFGVIHAASRHAAQASRNNNIGVLATQGTVHTKEYTRQITAENQRANVFEIACPNFVPVVEAGMADGEEAAFWSTEYLKPLAEQNCDTIILGCTHYPYLLATLRQAAEILFPTMPLFVDPAVQLMDDIKSILAESPLDATPQNTIYTTGNPIHFAEQAAVLAPKVKGNFQKLEWVCGDLKI